MVLNLDMDLDTDLYNSLPVQKKSNPFFLHIDDSAICRAIFYRSLCSTTIATGVDKQMIRLFYMACKLRCSAAQEKGKIVQTVEVNDSVFITLDLD
jgi:hypothetical protein